MILNTVLRKIPNTEDIMMLFGNMYHENMMTYDPTTNQKVLEIQNCNFWANSPYIINHTKVEYDTNWYIENYAVRLLYYNQYKKNIDRLAEDPYTRRAFLYMGSPYESNEKFPICTIGMQMILTGENRDKLNWIVNMRSNSVTKYTTDWKWQNKWWNKAVEDLSNQTKRTITKGTMFWNANSMHVYEEDFNILEETYKGTKWK